MSLTQDDVKGQLKKIQKIVTGKKKMKLSWLYSLSSVFLVKRLTSQSLFILSFVLIFNYFYVKSKAMNSWFLLLPNDKKVVAT